MSITIAPYTRYIQISIKHKELKAVGMDRKTRYMNNAHHPKKAKTFRYFTVSPSAVSDKNFLFSLSAPDLEN